jgi:hypothetical protein
MNAAGCRNFDSTATSPTSRLPVRRCNFIHSKDGYVDRLTNNVHPKGEKQNVHDSFSPDNYPHARAVHRRAHRLRAGPLEAFWQQRRRVTLRCISETARRPTSLKALAASGSNCTTTGPILTTWSSRRQTPTCGEAPSGHTYTFARRPDDTTDIDVIVVRDGKNLKGRLLGFVLRTVGKGVLERAFLNSVKAIEARNGAAKGKRAA